MEIILLTPPLKLRDGTCKYLEVDLKAWISLSETVLEGKTPSLPHSEFPCPCPTLLLLDLGRAFRGYQILWIVLKSEKANRGLGYGGIKKQETGGVTDLQDNANI